MEMINIYIRLGNHLCLVSYSVVVNLIFKGEKVRRKEKGKGRIGEKRIVGINGGMHATSLNWLKSDRVPGTIQKNCKLLTKLNFFAVHLSRIRTGF